MHTMSTADAADCIDWSAVWERFEGDEQLLREVIVLFLDDCPRRLAEVCDAVARHDSDALHHAAHSIKGSLANFAAHDAVHAAHCLEIMGRDNNLAGADETCRTLEREVARLTAVLASVR